MRIKTNNALNDLFFRIGLLLDDDDTQVLNI